MNYMDEQILNIKNKLNQNAASNNENTILSQTTVNNHDKNITEKNSTLWLGDKLITLEMRAILDGPPDVRHGGRQRMIVD